MDMLDHLADDGLPDIDYFGTEIVGFSGMIWNCKENKYRTLMAILIPALDSCVSRMTAGERCNAGRLKQKFGVINESVKDKMADMVHCGISAVDRKQISNGQYQAVLYDDAQSIYDRAKKKNFSFKSVGIQAQVRTTILKINYRNTRQILQTASLVAADLLTAEDKDEDGVPLLKPVSCGRDGEAPLIIRLPTLREEAAEVAEHLTAAHREGHAWGDMAILCRHWSEMDLCADVLTRRGLPHQVRKKAGQFDPGHDSIKVMSLHASKGLEFPVVAMVGVGHMPAEGEDEREEARLFYVGATRATQRLVIGCSGDGGFSMRLNSPIAVY